MNLFSLFAFFVFIANITMSVFVLRLDHRSALNRVFVLLNICSAFWVLGYTFLYPETNPEMTLFWYRFSSLGWCLMPSAIIHFILILTEKKKILSQWWFYAIIYTIPVVFLARSFTAPLIAESFVMGEWGNYEIHANQSVWYWFYSLYNMTMATIGGIILWRWGHYAKSMRQKKIARIVFRATIICFSVTYTLNLLLPALKLEKIPAIGALIMIVFIYAIWYAIRKYQLMVLSPEIASSEIISKMMDVMVLINPAGQIVKINRQATELLEFKESALIGKPYQTILPLNETTRAELSMVMTNQATEMQFDTYLLTSQGEKIPVIAFFSAVVDNAKDSIGTVMVAHDMRETITLKEAMIELSEERNKLQIRNEIMEKELELAKNIQMRLIPDTNPSQNISTYYRPMESVGGDFFDFISFDNPDLIGIFISDVSGHGVPAAFITSMIKSVILQVGAYYDNPAEFLDYLNGVLLSQTNGNFVTAFYAIYNQKTRELHYCNAGHNPPYVICENRVEVLNFEGRGVPLAVLSQEEMAFIGKKFRNQKTQLSGNSKLLLYTDGLIEAVNILDKTRDFEENGLFEKLLQMNHLSSKEFLDKISSQLVHFRGSETFDDDVCMICLDI